ncbi:tRNA dihydrouridine synthase DusB [Alkaliphilus serpentinus]|uniref:tRNA-dihydrouridine synthase n=1 Tax=Alkaliphilus serpentinus TaxID=1482731 RepID=A0A833MAZ3_9FIRM|nr:tRNA dihydrouridine synthase DusB [Alkaliphilus serpentinus]KAB3533807.1 tRNA dihydrouridine synthase DusB [Alkaliphilus serpentinus]
MKIGNVTLEKNVFLAPMAGVTDLPFRLLCMEMGCGMVYTEMVSSRGIYYKDSKTEELLKIHEREKPVAIQIFGSEPKVMAMAADYLNDRENIILDINMGCPAPKIVKNGDGSALMKTPKLAGEIVKEVVKASIKPVTVKIRKGWDESNINAVEMAKAMEANGATAITVHGRTRDQFYTGEADWDIIAEVKNSVGIPVIGNGDVFSLDDGIKLLDYSGCDGIMIGRGAQGNPWIFKEISTFVETGEIIPPPTLEERINIILKHMALVVEAKGEYIAIREMRKHISWYMKGYKNSAQLRNLVNKISTQREMENTLLRYLDNIEGI